MRQPDYRAYYSDTVCGIWQQGMTLFEVLISLIILAIGLLGVASMLLVANKANNSSYMKQQAIQSIYTIFDKMRANSQAAASGNYTVTNIGANGVPAAVTAPSPLCTSSACTQAQLAAYDTWAWLTRDVAQLPNGCGQITTARIAATGNTLITISVQWDDSAAQGLLGANSAASSVNPNYVQIQIQSQL